MSWDPVWEAVFSTRPWGKYPPEELIRFAARNYYAAPDRAAVKILEIGCGPGANIWYLARERFSACGIDGSPTAVEIARGRLAAEGLQADLQTGDIANLSRFYAPESFDAVVDIACLQHNSRENISHILANVKTVLKPGGRMFSMAVASGTYGDQTGKEIEPGTYSDIPVGPLEGKGLTHFFDLEQIHQLFGLFSPLKIEYSVRSLDERQHEYKIWIIEGINAS